MSIPFDFKDLNLIGVCMPILFDFKDLGLVGLCYLKAGERCYNGSVLMYSLCYEIVVIRTRLLVQK
jgi:hypothetical protein